MLERQKRVEIKKPSPILFINAHPDDESFGFGGIISKLTRKSIPVYIVSLTCGEAGESAINSQDSLGNIRKDELKSAASELGVSKENVFIGLLPDGELANNQDRVEKEILRIFELIKPGLIFTMHPQSTSHPDHIAIGNIILKLKESGLFGKTPIMLQYLPSKFRPNENDIKIRVFIGDVIVQKKSAIRKHETQKVDSERIIPKLLEYEYFIQIK